MVALALRHDPIGTGDDWIAAELEAALLDGTDAECNELISELKEIIAESGPIESGGRVYELLGGILIRRWADAY